MDPRYCAQEILLCDLCQAAALQSHYLNSEKEDVETNYEKLTTAVTKQGENLKKEIIFIVNKQKSDIGEMKAKHLAVLKKEEDEIKKITLDVQQSICDLKAMLDSNNVSFISAHKSRNAEFKKLSSKVSISLPTFSPKVIISENISEMFGSLSALSTTEEHDYKVVLDEPEFITAIQTGYDELFSLTCYGEDEIWMRGRNRFKKLYNL
ncbi:uncharacterized protein LOC134248209 [Saccostrea cucullata]|uniref:uncharacterized protein LOC134248209 n=1 Tax=Saccostrea cuccullata TaxID=36930 RepID=UPI002ED28054